jgi:hypothetical protein
LEKTTGFLCASKQKGTVGTLTLTMPFILLSMRILFETEIEKRYLTPFGIVDVIFRPRGMGKKQKSHLVVEMGGDAEHVVSWEAHIEKSATSLLSVVWDMAKGYLPDGIRSAFDEVSIDIKGYEIDLTAPWGNSIFGELKGLTEHRSMPDETP